MEKNTITISNEILNEMLNKLAERPYNEVANIINKVMQNVAELNTKKPIAPNEQS